MPPKASVIIPTRNRADALRRCLEALREQAQQAGSFEIIVVDDGSTDETCRLVSETSAESAIPVRLIELGKQMGPAAARNRGIAEAEGEIVVFIGDDIIVRNDFVAEHLAAHSEFPRTPYAVLGYTTWHPELESSPFMRWLETSGMQFEYPWIDRYGPTWRHFYTSNLSLKRSFLLKNGLFDEAFKAAAFEDIDLGYRLSKHGLRIIYRPKASAYHLHPNCAPDRAWAQRTSSRGFYEMMFERKHAELSEGVDADVGLWRQILLTSIMEEQSMDPLLNAVGNRPLSEESPESRWLQEFGASSIDAVAAFYTRRGAASFLCRDYPGLSTAASHYAAALEAEGGRDQSRAFAEVIAMRRAEPSLVSLAFLSADLFLRHGKPHAAAKQYREIMRIRPGHAYAALRLAELLREMAGDDADARRLFETALERETLAGEYLARAFMGLGLVLMADGSHRAALKLFKSGLETPSNNLNTTSSCCLYLAEALNAIGKRDEALQWLQHVSRFGLIVSNIRAQSLLLEANIAAQKEELAKALKLLQEASLCCINNDGLLGEIDFTTAEVLLRLKRRALAIVHLERIVFSKKPPRLVNEAASIIAEFAADDGRLDDLRRALSNVCPEYPLGELAERRLAYANGLLLLRQGEHDRALEELRKARKLPVSSPDRREWFDFNILLCLSGLGRYDEAAAVVTRLERTLNRRDSLVRSLAFEAGKVFQRLGRLRAAANRFRKAIALGSPDELSTGWARYSLAETLAQLGKVDEALEHLRLIVTTFRQADLVASARLKIGCLLFDRGDVKAAYSEFKAGAEACRGNDTMLSHAVFNLGRCCKALGRTKEAAAYFRKAQHLVIDPEMLLTSLWVWAFLTAPEDSPSEALQAFENAAVTFIEKNRFSLDTGYRSAILLHDAKAYSGAARLLKSLSNVTDLDRRFWRYLLAYSTAGFLTGAEAMMSSLEFLPPSEQADWHLSAAALLVEMGYDRDAEDELRAALRLRPDWPQANYMLGSVLERQQNLDEAQVRFEAVIEHERGIAQEAWNRMVGGAHYHLACILAQLGLKTNALDNLRSCLRYLPHHQKAKQLSLSLSSELETPA